MEDMRTLRPLPDIPIGLPISRLLETFSMDLQSGEHFSQESLHTSLEQDSDIRKYVGIRNKPFFMTVNAK